MKTELQDLTHLSPSRIADALKLFADQSTEAALMIFDSERRILWCNPACDSLFGYAKDELTGKPIYVLFTREDEAKGVPDYEFDVAANSEDMQNDRWMQRADGSKFWATGNTTGLRDGEGNIVGFVKTLRDSTDLREQMEALRNRQQALAEANEQKDRFLAQLSHELRNPLGALSNAVAAIQARGSSAQQLTPDFVGIIARQTDSLRRMVDDLLDVTRIGAGNVRLDFKTIDIKDPISSAVETVQPEIRKRQQIFVQNILQTAMRVRADERRLEQVFVNLLVNASKYTPEGGKIELRASANGTEAWVHVIDNGIGIAPDLLPRVFDLFTRSDDAKVNSIDGLGIGLSLVKEFVQLHGGSVQVRSDGPGKGSEFTVRLPTSNRPALKSV